MFQPSLHSISWFMLGLLHQILSKCRGTSTGVSNLVASTSERRTKGKLCSCSSRSTTCGNPPLNQHHHQFLRCPRGHPHCLRASPSRHQHPSFSSSMAWWASTEMVQAWHRMGQAWPYASMMASMTLVATSPPQLWRRWKGHPLPTKPVALLYSTSIAMSSWQLGKPCAMNFLTHVWWRIQY